MQALLPRLREPAASIRPSSWTSPWTTVLRDQQSEPRRDDVALSKLSVHATEASREGPPSRRGRSAGRHSRAKLRSGLTTSRASSGSREEEQVVGHKRGDDHAPNLGARPALRLSWCGSLPNSIAWQAGYFGRSPAPEGPDQVCAGQQPFLLDVAGPGFEPG